MQMPCAYCGQLHDIENLELSFRRPDALLAIPEAQRETACNFTDDAGMLADPAYPKDLRFFLRGNLKLPVRDRAEPFGIGLWVEVDAVGYKDFLNYYAKNSMGDGIAGSIANEVPGYATSTLAQPVTLRFIDLETRPDFRIRRPGHPMWEEQQQGITRERMMALLAPILH